MSAEPTKHKPLIRLRVAGIYHVAVGAFLCVAPQYAVRFMGAQAHGIVFLRGVGLMLLLFGLMYWALAKTWERAPLVTAIAVFGKFAGFIGCAIAVFAHWLPAHALYGSLLHDVIWWPVLGRLMLGPRISPDGKYLYPPAPADHPPHPWWYYGWVVFANRMQISLAVFTGAAVVAFIAVPGYVQRLPWLVALAAVVALAGFAALANALYGLFRIYGPPSMKYMRRLVEMAGVTGKVQVADLHIGTYRYARILAELLPDATVQSVDLWDEKMAEAEANLRLLRTLETAPQDNPRIVCSMPAGGRVPLADGSCDAVLLGLGIHELEKGPAQDNLFAEAARITKAGGVVMLFEHTVDFQSFTIFGPEYSHWTKREEWMALLARHLTDVKHEHHKYAVDLFTARKG